MRSTPSSVSFCTTHSGRSPLTGAKATVMSGADPGLALFRTVDLEGERAAGGRATPGTGCSRHGIHDPAPSEATTGSPVRRRRTSTR